MGLVVGGSHVLEKENIMERILYYVSGNLRSTVIWALKFSIF